MAKINLTIPDDLKEKMSGYTNANWSRVASEAFAQAIEKEKLMALDMNDIEKVAARFKAEIVKEESHCEEAGDRWAREYASANQMKAIDATEDECYAETMDVIAQEYYEEFRIRFWEEMIGEDSPLRDNKTVFARGAMKVWSEVKQHL